MEPLKNLFNHQTVEHLALILSNNCPIFDKPLFLSSFENLEALELKQRGDLIVHNLNRSMPQDFKLCEEIILKSLIPAIEEDTLTQMRSTPTHLGGWILWPIQFFLLHRLNEDKTLVVPVFNLLKEMTTRFSSEFSIRHLLKEHFCIVHPLLISLALDPNVHVRRWVSEGTRPRLPWGIKLEKFCTDPSLNIEILKAVQSDQSLYVRKSVANHLNDISKDNPEFVIFWAKKYWPQAQKNSLLYWTLKHGLRTLIKKGNKEVLALLGASDIKIENIKAKVTSEVLKKNNKTSQEINLSFNCDSQNSVILDFKLIYPGKNKPKIKIIKGKSFTSNIGTNFVNKKFNLFDNSVAFFEKGNYELEIIINGNCIQKLFWALV